MIYIALIIQVFVLYFLWSSKGKIRRGEELLIVVSLIILLSFLMNISQNLVPVFLPNLEPLPFPRDIWAILLSVAFLIVFYAISQNKLELKGPDGSVIISEERKTLLEINKISFEVITGPIKFFAWGIGVIYVTLSWYETTFEKWKNKIESDLKVEIISINPSLIALEKIFLEGTENEKENALFLLSQYGPPAIPYIYRGFSKSGLKAELSQSMTDYISIYFDKQKKKIRDTFNQTARSMTFMALRFFGRKSNADLEVMKDEAIKNLENNLEGFPGIARKRLNLGSKEVQIGLEQAKIILRAIVEIGSKIEKDASLKGKFKEVLEDFHNEKLKDYEKPQDKTDLNQIIKGFKTN